MRDCVSPRGRLRIASPTCSRKLCLAVRTASAEGQQVRQIASFAPSIRSPSVLSALAHHSMIIDGQCSAVVHESWLARASECQCFGEKVDTATDRASTNGLSRPRLTSTSTTLTEVSYFAESRDPLPHSVRCMIALLFQLSESHAWRMECVDRALLMEIGVHRYTAGSAALERVGVSPSWFMRYCTRLAQSIHPPTPHAKCPSAV